MHECTQMLNQGTKYTYAVQIWWSKLRKLRNLRPPETPIQHLGLRQNIESRIQHQNADVHLCLAPCSVEHTREPAYKRTIVHYAYVSTLQFPVLAHMFYQNPCRVSSLSRDLLAQNFIHEFEAGRQVTKLDSESIFLISQPTSNLWRKY